MSLTAGLFFHATLFSMAIHQLISAFFLQPTSGPSATLEQMWMRVACTYLAPVLFTASILAMVAGLWGTDVPLDTFYYGLSGLFGWIVLGVWDRKNEFSAFALLFMAGVGLIALGITV